MKKQMILIADDEPNIRLLVKNTLSRETYELLEAVDGVEALDRIRTSQPDLVILDLSMPRLGGLDVLQHLKAEPPPRPPKIIVLTALAQTQDERRALDAGAHHYLRKPFSPLELMEVIEQTLAQRVP